MSRSRCPGVPGRAARAPLRFGRAARTIPPAVSDATSEAAMCSFCARSAPIAVVLLQTHEASICEECVSLCNDVVVERQFAAADAEPNAIVTAVADAVRPYMAQWFASGRDRAELERVAASAMAAAIETAERDAAASAVFNASPDLHAIGDDGDEFADITGVIRREPPREIDPNRGGR